MLKVGSLSTALVLVTTAALGQERILDARTMFDLFVKAKIAETACHFPGGAQLVQRERTSEGISFEEIAQSERDDIELNAYKKMTQLSAEEFCSHVLPTLITLRRSWETLDKIKAKHSRTTN